MSEWHLRERKNPQKEKKEIKPQISERTARALILEELESIGEVNWVIESIKFDPHETFPNWIAICLPIARDDYEVESAEVSIYDGSGAFMGYRPTLKTEKEASN